MEESKKLLQWHPAFYAGIRIELEEEAEQLIFENEHMLSTKPMQIDVLITKKDADRKINKNIGQIFRKYNLIEYKSPNDYLSVNDFYKVLGYAFFYMADTPHVKEIRSEEITISYVCFRYPRELINHLCDKGYTVENKEEGIYYVQGMGFPVQIIVNSELPEEKNLWLKNLSNKISTTKAVEQLAHAYEGKKDNELYSSVMDILIRANKETFSEVKAVCEALKELFKEELEEQWNEGVKAGINQGISQGTRLGIISTLVQLVRDDLLTLSVAAERAKMSVEEFQKQL